MITISIPEEVYTMKAKRSIIKNNALLYRKASKKQRKEILCAPLSVRINHGYYQASANKCLLDFPGRKELI
ncbi:MAG: hypothetical protein ABIL70_04310 [candidate division WOR-3 bacterium]